jgi:RND family efflux transporter MFP subunit
MLIFRGAGSKARPLNASTLLGAVGIALCVIAQPVRLSAHEGHDHGAPTPALPVIAEPRASAATEAHEVTAVLNGDELEIFVDSFADNAPVTKATVTVTIGATRRRAPLTSDGVYKVAAPELAKPGKHELVISIEDGVTSDLVITTLDNPAGSAALANKPAAAPQQQAPILSGSAPRRLPDTSVFLPKASQRLLDVRTQLTANTATRPTLSFTGRIIANPDKSGVVQSSTGGRLTQPIGGLPRLGQAVKAGDVLATVTPAYLAIDATQVAQTAGDLDQQIDLARTKLARAEKLLATNAGTRVQVEETELQLRGLLARRAALNASQVKTETLIAPVDGVIAGIKATPGQVVVPQDILFEIVDASSFWVEAYAYDASAPQTFVSATAATQDGLSVPLKFVGRSRTLRQQATVLQFEVDGSQATLSVGMLVRVTAQAGDPVSAIIAPKAAVVRAGNGEEIVWRHTDTERFVAVAVKTAPFDGDHVRIESGLKPGERIVVRSAELINQVR